MTTNILPLKGAIQHYHWGGYNYIPQLLNIDNQNHQPFAELWMGAHPSAPSIVKENGTETPLDVWIDQAPTTILGTSVALQFQNRLPFLFKVLDVSKMLSIQAHPTKQQAEEGFQRENEMGIPFDAPHRNYKDDNHKPEIMVALTDFWLLHGFKPMEEVQATIRTVPEFHPLQAIADTNSIYELYKYVMEMPPPEVDAMLKPLEQRLNTENPAKNSPDYWAKRAFEDFPTQNGHYDRGVFSIYFFHLVYLKPGEGIFQGAGIPHAYLEGVNVELMSNSDNVFRGGLTNKHVDVPELLKSLVFEPVNPNILSGTMLSTTEWVYLTPAPDFELRKIEVNQQYSHYEKNDTPSILIVLNGSVSVNGEHHFEKGGIFFVPAGVSFTIQAEEASTLFKASVP
ncbi:MAG: mannose-6-phosphate isomerase, class I [Saprospiraceae bacterium]|nr:mannose-6-phosphate isomerase, class I [Saprospiraceae bacterium]